MKDIQKLQDDVKQWSDETFGRHRTGIPIAYHLKKEINELIDALEKYHKATYRMVDMDVDLAEKLQAEDLKRIKFEAVDCLTLLIDAAAHEGITMEQLIDASFTKLEINKTREWGEPDENGVVEHIEK